MNKKLKFKVGDKIIKPKGYNFIGTVLSVFDTLKGETRIVAESEDNKMILVFCEDQIEILHN